MTNSTTPLEIRIRTSPNSKTGVVWSHLKGERLRRDPNAALRDTLEARFLPAALKTKGLLTQDIARECIWKLKGYIYEIEQLAEIPSSLPENLIAVANNERGANNTSVEKRNKVAPPEPAVNLDEMFGFTDDGTVKG